MIINKVDDFLCLDALALIPFVENVAQKSREVQRIAIV